MPRARTGTVKLHGDHWDARITLDDGSRPWIHLPPGLTEKQARARAAKASTVAHERGAVRAGAGAKAAGGGGETFAEWSERWIAERAARGLASVDTDRGRLRKWILPTLGDKPVASVTRQDIEALVEHLDTAVRAGRCSWKTAINAWGLVSKAMGDACGSKVRALRCRDDNPAANVRGPDRGVIRAKTYLYPSEFLQVVRCEDVDLTWRRAITLAVYLYPRASELRGLRWGQDVDLAHRAAHVHRTVARDDPGGKSTKTKRGRTVPIEPALMPLLKALHQEAGGAGDVIELPDTRHLARALHVVLRKARLTRPALFSSEATRKPLSWHDLRATGITWRAVRGDDPLKIMAAAGHEDFETTQGYIREADVIRDGFGDVFPPLPACLMPNGGGGGSDVEVPHAGAESSAAIVQGGVTTGNYSGGAGNRIPHGGEDPHGSRTDPDVKADLVAPISTAKPRVSGTAADSPDDTADPGEALGRALEAAVGACVAGGDLAGARAALDALAALRRARRSA